MYREIDVLTIEDCPTKIIVYHQELNKGVKFGSTDTCLESIKFAFGAVNVVNIIELPVTSGFSSESAYSVVYQVPSLFRRKNICKSIWVERNGSGKPCFKSKYKILRAKETGAGVITKYPKNAICEMDATKLKGESDNESQK